jgi:hypothetical protein
MIYIDTILYVLLLIEIIAIFLQGFYFGRKNNSGIYIMTTIVLIALFMIILLDGTKLFTLRVLSAGIYELMVSITYSIFCWGLGYYLSGLYFIRKDEKGVILKLR